MELGTKHNVGMHLEMLETIKSLKEDMEILKLDNCKFMNTKSDQEEINEFILKV